MESRRGRASTAGLDWKQSFSFLRPPAATDPEETDDGFKSSGSLLIFKPPFAEN